MRLIFMKSQHYVSNDIKNGKEDACLYLKCKGKYFLQKKSIHILLKCIGTVLQDMDEAI